jgi:hypothetical protein
MIDPQNGNLVFAPSLRVRPGDSLETVIALALGESNEVNDVHTGWKWLPARNVRVGPDYFALQLGFYHNRLKMVLLDVSQERFEPVANWDACTEQTAMQRLRVLQKWVRKEVGHEGQFPWGVIEAGYDFKNVSSSIIIRYE